MPYSITCPSCSAKLKTTTAIPIGRSVQCPKCKESFAVSAKNMVEAADSKFLPPNPGAAKAAATPAKKAPVAADTHVNSLDDAPPRKSHRDEDEDERPRSRSRRDEDDEDDRPRRKSRNDDDDDDRPRAKRRDDDDEDDRPRRKRRDDDEDDDRPRSRHRDDDDVDERPSRRGRDDDDYDDDRPRRAKKKKKSSLPIMIGLSLAGLIALAGIGYLIYSLFAGGGGAYDTEMIAFLPGDSTMVVGVDLDELASNTKLKEFVQRVGKQAGEDPLKEANDKLKPAGLTTDDFSRLVVGGQMDKGAEPTAVVRTKKSFDKAKFAEFMDCKKEEKKDGKTYYSDGGDGVVYFPSDTLAVRTTKKHYETLAKESGKVLLSEEMQDLAKKLSKGHFWVAMSKNALPKQAMDQIDLAKAVRIPYVPPEFIDAVKDMKGFGFWVKADGDKVKFGAGVLCNKQEVAEKAEEKMKKEIDEQRSKKLEDNDLIKQGLGSKEVPSEVKSMMTNLQKSFAADRSGALVEFSGEFTLGDLEGLIKQFGPGTPFAPRKAPPEVPVPKRKK